MLDDPIVEEVHRVRDKLIEEHGGDIDRYIEHLRELEKQHPQRLVRPAPSKDVKARIEALLASESPAS